MILYLQFLQSVRRSYKGTSKSSSLWNNTNNHNFSKFTIPYPNGRNRETPLTISLTVSPVREAVTEPRGPTNLVLRLLVQRAHRNTSCRHLRKGRRRQRIWHGGEPVVYIILSRRKHGYKFCNKFSFIRIALAPERERIWEQLRKKITRLKGT